MVPSPSVDRVSIDGAHLLIQLVSLPAERIRALREVEQNSTSFHCRLRKIGKNTTPALDFAEMRVDLRLNRLKDVHDSIAVVVA